MSQYGATGRRFAAVGALTLGLMLAGLPARAETLRLGYESWVAPGPFFIAREKGWFEEEGVSVELVNIEDARIRVSALATGEVDAVTANIDEAILHLGSDPSLRFAFAIAESAGGDGLIAANDITDIAGLSGSRVAVQPGTSRQFYLYALLRDSGLTQADFVPVAMAPGEAGLAFERRQVDAAVTWQPWLARTALMDDGHVLTETSQQPGLLVEAVVTRARVLDEREDDLRALYRAWLRAVEWARKNPEDSALLVAHGVGRWLRNELVVKEMREGIAYYDKAMNAEFFGTVDQPGPIAGTVTAAIDVWTALGRMQVAPNAPELVDRRIVLAE
jgi:NitT/TauT family transport system substrate-binding protein